MGKAPVLHGVAVTTSWVPSADGSGFGLENLPYGVIRPRGGRQRIAVRIGDYALDLAATVRAGLLEVPSGVFEAPTLNRFLELGQPSWSTTRSRLTELLAADTGSAASLEPLLIPVSQTETVMPVVIGDFVDFFSSLEHATNVGRLFRPGQDPLLANWRHMPIGYHGRAGTVVISDTPIRRPSGQRPPARPGDPPTFGSERRLDFELELGFFTGKGPALGSSLDIARAGELIFGFVLVNDWSAREIQRWEYRPLGPFLGKSFATSTSPWIVPTEALGAAFIDGRAQDPPPLPYLRDTEPRSLNVALEVSLIEPGSQTETVLARTNARDLYWSPSQQLAHASVNGASIGAGDLFASGTISGAARGTQGSLLELTCDGAHSISLDGGGQRTFLQDGDTIVMRGCAGPVSFGEVRNRVVPGASPGDVPAV